MTECWCYVCNQGRIDPVLGLPVNVTRMIVCPECGNKRCPHSTSHELPCAQSNAPGQPGSRYPAVT